MHTFIMSAGGDTFLARVDYSSCACAPASWVENKCALKHIDNGSVRAMRISEFLLYRE